MRELDPGPRPATARTDDAAPAAALITVTLWGSAFVAIRDAGQTLSSGSLALGRLLIGAIVLGVAAAAVDGDPDQAGLAGGLGDEVRHRQGQSAYERDQRGETSDRANVVVIVAQAFRVRSRRGGPDSPSRSQPVCSMRTTVRASRAVKVTSTSVASAGSKKRCQQ
jgi:hypothetical protein